MRDESQDQPLLDIPIDPNDPSTMEGVPDRILMDMEPTESIMTELLARAMPPDTRWAAYPENISRFEAKAEEMRKFIEGIRQRVQSAEPPSSEQAV